MNEKPQRNETTKGYFFHGVKVRQNESVIFLVFEDTLHGSIPQFAGKLAAFLVEVIVALVFVLVYLLYHCP